MSIFKKKAENNEEWTDEEINDAKVKILGGGCSSCIALEKATSQALKELGIDQKIGHVTDFSKIAAYGVMSTPALVVNEKVLSYGKVLKAKEVKELLKKEGFKG